jgi:hypothetical protein
MRKLTQEQKERAKERRQKLCALARSISKMPISEREKLVGDWPTTIDGHRLSLHNACMIAFQGGATVVGGFQQWRKAGRQVRKGAHGLGIWIPLGLPKRTDDEAQTNEGSPIGFSVATVFDVSQTEEAVLREAVTV